MIKEKNFLEQNREINNTEYRNREIEKYRNIQHSIHISRSGDRPQEIHLDQKEVVAKPPEVSGKGSNESAASWKQDQQKRRDYIQEKIAQSAKYLYDNPEEMFYISVSIYHYRPSKPDRLSINVDFIQQPGAKPFQVSAHCVSRVRKRELLQNVRDPNWQGYQLALYESGQKPNGEVFIGKLKNRAKNNSRIKKILIPNTVLIATVNANNTVDVEIIINDVSHKLCCMPQEGNNFFSHRAELQNNDEEMYDF